MKVSVLTRTEESGRRIIYGIYVDDEKGTSEEKARKGGADEDDYGLIEQDEFKFELNKINLIQITIN